MNLVVQGTEYILNDKNEPYVVVHVADLLLTRDEWESIVPKIKRDYTIEVELK